MFYFLLRFQRPYGQAPPRNAFGVARRGTRSPEFKISTSTLACNWDENVNYLPVICFNGLAEIASQYISKGKAIQLEGALKQNIFQNKEGKTEASFKLSPREST